MNRNLRLNIGEVNGDGLQVVEFIGEFDKVGQMDVKEELELLISGFAAEVLLFDLSQMRFINSEGIGLLMDMANTLAQRSKKLAIMGAAMNVDDIFEAIGLKDVVDVYDDLEDFLS